MGRHPDADSVSWTALHAAAEAGALTVDGRRAVRFVLNTLEGLLGSTWPRRQRAAFGGLPGELGMFAFHAAALPRFLTLGLQLAAAAEEPTFGRVRSGLRRGPLGPTDWRHLLLQLEVARLGMATGRPARFEPPIPGTDRRADVVLDGRSTEPPIVVETTSLFRSMPDREHEGYEQRLSDSLLAIEQQYGVFIRTHLTSHLDDKATAAWLRDIADAAAQVRRTGGPQTILRAPGKSTIEATPPAAGTTTFAGALRQGDAWRRLARTIGEKVRQTSNSGSAWIRIDALDGFFQFTDWDGEPWPVRIDRLAAALRAAFDDAPHVAGIVLSSGAATNPGALHSPTENTTATTRAGTGLRRLIAPHLDDLFQGVGWLKCVGGARQVELLDDVPAGRSVPRCGVARSGCARGCPPSALQPDAEPRRSSWTPTWTPSRPHCTYAPTIC